MNTRGRTILSCAVALCMAFCLCACNPKEKIDELLTPTSVAEAIAAKTEENQPTVSTPAIIEDGYLTVGLRTAETTAPFCIVQSSGEVSGMDIEIASLLADALGLKVRFVNVVSVEASLGVDCDIVMNVAVGDAGGATVVGAYAENATALFRVGGSGIASADELYGATVGLQSGSVSQRALAEQGIGMYENSYDNLNEAFEALAAGEVQYVCCAAPSTFPPPRASPWQRTTPPCRSTSSLRSILSRPTALCRSCASGGSRAWQTPPTQARSRESSSASFRGEI